MKRKIRVVVIDDSPFSRRAISKMLEDMPQVEVVGSASGEEGLRKIIDLKPDLVTLDLIMPKMDGFTLLRLIMNSCPLPVIVISSRKDDRCVFKALELGAVDFVAKPGHMALDELMMIREDLQNKVRSVIGLNMSRMLSAGNHNPAVQPITVNDFLISPGNRRKDVVGIGASTGGPQALQKIFTSFPAPLPFAVVVAQHMPSGFTLAFAERLGRISGFDVKEAEDGDVVRQGRVLVAPGGWNLVFQKVGCNVVARLVRPSAEYRYFPSVDAMFTSLASVYGDRVLAVVLTGMGNDGSKGVRAVKAAGGDILAEAEKSAIVFGMPREAIATNLVDRVAPLERISSEIISMCTLEQK